MHPAVEELPVEKVNVTAKHMPLICGEKVSLFCVYVCLFVLGNSGGHQDRCEYV